MPISPATSIWVRPIKNLSSTMRLSLSGSFSMPLFIATRFSQLSSLAVSSFI